MRISEIYERAILFLNTAIWNGEKNILAIFSLLSVCLSIRRENKKYKNCLTYPISMLLYNHVANAYNADMNNGGIIYEQDFR